MRSTGLWTYVAMAGLTILICLALFISPRSSPVSATPLAPRTFTDFIHPSFSAAVVIHWSGLLKSPLIPPARGSEAYHWLVKAGNSSEVKILDPLSPEKIHRMAVLFQPDLKEKSGIAYAITVEMEEDTDFQQGLTAAFPDFSQVLFEGKAYQKSNNAGRDGTPLAAHIAGPRMLVIAPEPMLRKMASKKVGPQPLVEQLKHADLTSDVLVEGAGKPIALMLETLISNGSKDKTLTETLQNVVQAETKSVSAQLSFTSDTLLKATVYGQNSDSIEKLYAVAGMVQGMAALKPQPARPQGSGKPPNIAEELLKGLTVNRSPDSLVILLKTPASLGELARQSGKK